MASYSIVDIPGWEYLSLTDGDADRTRRRIAELAAATVSDAVGRDRATPFREEVRKQFERLAGAARASGATLLCLPTEEVGGHAVPATYSAGEWADTATFREDPGAVVAAIAEGADADVAVTVGTIDGQPSVREERVAEADPDADPLAQHPARTITYTVASPNEPGRWTVFTFATYGAADPDGPLAEVLVELFDAHIQTLRWTR